MTDDRCNSKPPDVLNSPSAATSDQQFDLGDQGCQRVQGDQHDLRNQDDHGDQVEQDDIEEEEDYWKKVVAAKDRIIRDQALKIERLVEEMGAMRDTRREEIAGLKGDLKRLGDARKALGSRLALVSYQLHLATSERTDLPAPENSLPTAYIQHHNDVIENVCSFQQLPAYSTSGPVNHCDNSYTIGSIEQHPSLSGIIDECDSLRAERMAREANAARIIQQAYRRHSLHRNFVKLRSEAAISSSDTDPNLNGGDSDAGREFISGGVAGHELRRSRRFGESARRGFSRILRRESNDEISQGIVFGETARTPVDLKSSCDMIKSSVADSDMSAPSRHDTADNTISNGYHSDIDDNCISPLISPSFPETSPAYSPTLSLTALQTVPLPQLPTLSTQHWLPSCGSANEVNRDEETAVGNNRCDCDCCKIRWNNCHDGQQAIGCNVAMNGSGCCQCSGSVRQEYCAGNSAKVTMDSRRDIERIERDCDGSPSNYLNNVSWPTKTGGFVGVSNNRLDNSFSSGILVSQHRNCCCCCHKVYKSLQCHQDSKTKCLSYYSDCESHCDKNNAHRFSCGHCSSTASSDTKALTRVTRCSCYHDTITNSCPGSTRTSDVVCINPDNDRDPSHIRNQNPAVRHSTQNNNRSNDQAAVISHASDISSNWDKHQCPCLERLHSIPTSTGHRTSDNQTGDHKSRNHNCRDHGTRDRGTGEHQSSPIWKRKSSIAGDESNVIENGSADEGPADYTLVGNCSSDSVCPQTTGYGSSDAHRFCFSSNSCVYRISSGGWKTGNFAKTLSHSYGVDGGDLRIGSAAGSCFRTGGCQFYNPAAERHGKEDRRGGEKGGGEKLSGFREGEGSGGGVRRLHCESDEYICRSRDGASSLSDGEGSLRGSSGSIERVSGGSEIASVDSSETYHSTCFENSGFPRTSSDTSATCPDDALTGQEDRAVADRKRKRAYRIGLNIFNRSPQKGIDYFIAHLFIETSPYAVAKFLLTRKGLSKQMIGEYLGNLQQPFNMEVLECCADQIDLSRLTIDEALRKFQSYFRMPGEAQKIERIMEVFASSYCESNVDVARKFHSSDTVFLLAYAIVMLNTDLHSVSIKPERRMKQHEFIRNLRGIDGHADVDALLLAGIYERIRVNPFRASSDHVTQVVKIEEMITGKKPITKMCTARKKSTSVMYNFRQLFTLHAMIIHLFETTYFPYGVQLSSGADRRVLALLSARNQNDQLKFVHDLREAILEVNEMEALRVNEELKRHTSISPAPCIPKPSPALGVPHPSPAVFRTLTTPSLSGPFNPSSTTTAPKITRHSPSVAAPPIETLIRPEKNHQAWTPSSGANCRSWEPTTRSSSSRHTMIEQGILDGGVEVDSRGLKVGGLGGRGAHRISAVECGGVGAGEAAQLGSSLSIIDSSPGRVTKHASSASIDSGLPPSLTSGSTCNCHCPELSPVNNHSCLQNHDPPLRLPPVPLPPASPQSSSSYSPPSSSSSGVAVLTTTSCIPEPRATITPAMSTAPTPTTMTTSKFSLFGKKSKSTSS